MSENDSNEETTTATLDGDERLALETIVDIMSNGCDGMVADGPLSDDLAARLVARGLIDGKRMPAHPEFSGPEDFDDIGDQIERVAYWLTPAGERALEASS